MVSHNKSLSEKQNLKLPLSNDGIDDDLQDLRQQFFELRRERLKSEKDEKLIANKMRLLSNEEIKVKKKKGIEIYTQGNIEKIRVKLLQDKEIVDQAKKMRLKELNNKKKNTKQMKHHIKTTLKTWRNQLERHKQHEGKIIKREKSKIEEVIQLNQEEAQKRNKIMHDNIAYYQSIVKERKKKEEIDRKIKAKQDLEERIKKEIAVKNKMDKMINDHQEESMQIVKRISSFSDLGLNHSLSKKEVKGLSNHSSISHISKHK